MTEAVGAAGTGADGDLLVFIHIPKTAGTTFTSILKLNAPGPAFRSTGNVFKGGGGINKEARFERLRAEGGEELAGVRILAGHVPLGFREHLPTGRRLRCFTLLREPVDRTLSHYFQVRDRRGGAEEPTKAKLDLAPLPADATLEQTLEAGYIHDNVHTRMLCGLPEPFGEVTRKMLDQAKRNLRDELLFVGLTERFDESLALAKQRLGLRTVLYQGPGEGGDRSARRASGRVNLNRPRGDEVPNELRQAAEACNRYDLELYDYAKGLFEAAVQEAGLEFDVELAAFRAARAEGEIDLEVPRPAGFEADEEVWRMLLEAKASVLRDERELAKIRTLTYRFGGDDAEVLSALRELKVKNALAAGADAEAASMRVIQMLRGIGAAVRAGGVEPAPAPAAPDGDGARQRARGETNGQEGGRSTSTPPGAQAEAASGTSRKPRRRSAASSGAGSTRKPRTGRKAARRQAAADTPKGARGRPRNASRTPSEGSGSSSRPGKKSRRRSSRGSQE